MTLLQRRRYFRLWAAACAVQGWNAADEAMRRDVTLTATGKPSTSRLDQDEITDLFDFLIWQADPDSIDKAIPVANPDVSRERNRCRQLIHVIEGLRFDDAYIARPAAAFCDEEQAATWRDLSSASLEKLRNTLKTRARERDAREGKRPDFIRRVTPYHQRKSTKERKAAERQPHVVPRPGVDPAAHSDLLPF